MWDEPHDRARRGRAPSKPRRGDHRGCGRRIEGATEGAARQTPPPPCRGTRATPRACDARATAGKRQGPPPTSLRPPKGGGCRKGGAGSGPPSPAGGAPGDGTQRGQGEDKGHAACLTPQQEDKCRAACQCRACDVLTPEEGQRGRPPPPAPTSRTHQGQRRGQRGEGEGTRGKTVAGGGPPPPGTPRRGGETEGRDDRAQGGHAPCKPPRRDRWGCNRKKGRVTTGATRQPPPPSGGTSAVPRACAVLPTCLRKRQDSENAPPPPAPFSDAHPQKGRGRRGDSERTWKKKTQSEQPRTPTRQSRDRQQGQTGHGGSQGAQQGARVSAPGDESWEAGTNGRGRGDKSPRTTLVRYPTSGVWGPPRCPYRPHLSASNKVGYARDRWPAARGGTGLGGWPMGLTKSTPHGTYCGSCPVRGCG